MRSPLLALALSLVALASSGCITSNARTPPPDSSGPDATSDAGSCAEGPKRCYGNTVERCVGGAYVKDSECAAETTCVQGECLPSTGEAGCNEIFWCAMECGSDQGCFKRCRLRGTEQAQGDFDDLVDCSVQEYETGADFVEACDVFARDCFYPAGVGPQVCSELSQCVQSTCGAVDEAFLSPDFHVCVEGCVKKGTVNAQLVYTRLELCQLVVCTAVDEPTWPCTTDGMFSVAECQPYLDGCGVGQEPVPAN